MDIYVEKVNDIEIEAPTGATDVSATYTFNDSAEAALSITASSEEDVYDATLPYLEAEGTVAVNWTFTTGGKTFTKTQKYNVVTPYISTRWIKKNLMEGSSDEEIRGAEAAARYIVQAHTGQTFGKVTETKIITGAGGDSLALPARAISIDTINGVALPASYSITGDGWYLSHPRFGLPSIRADYYGIHEANGVIENPYGYHYQTFIKDGKFEIAGTWGYDEVPDAVTEAMKLLVNDYASGDSMYRDRYLVSMTAADWRIQFTNGAFSQTGNVRADQLLSEFVLKSGWAVL